MIFLNAPKEKRFRYVVGEDLAVRMEHATGNGACRRMTGIVTAQRYKEQIAF
jgi:hypothetical protein